MSSATVAITIEGAALVLLGLFTVGLLRSHADILRRLAQLEGADDGSPGPSAPRTVVSAATSVSDFAGQTVDGDAVKVGFSRGAPDTLLAFLSSGCGSCHALWDALRAGARGPAGTRLIVVTKGPDAESVTLLREIASPKVDTVMSTDAWEVFSVPSTPHFVLVDGRSAQIAGRGAATSWEQLLTLVAQAAGDSAHHRRGGRGSSDRARRAEEALAGAGIAAGHPSLYPSRGLQAERAEK